MRQHDIRLLCLCREKDIRVKIYQFTSIHASNHLACVVLGFACPFTPVVIAKSHTSFTFPDTFIAQALMFSPPKAANAVAANPFNFAAFSGGGQPAQKVRSGWANAAKPPPPPVPPSGFASLTSGSSPGGHSHKAGNSASNSDEIGLLSDLQRRSLESSVRVWAAGDLLAEGCARFQLQHHAAHTSDATATTPTPTPSSSANTIAGQPTAAAPPLESFARAADQPPGIAAAMPHFVLPPEHGGNPARALLCYQLAPRALNARSAVQPVGPGVDRKSVV